MLGVFHLVRGVRQCREHHRLLGICAEQQTAALTVNDLCPAHGGLCTALLRHKILCDVLGNLILVDAQLCTMLTVPVGFRRAIAVPFYGVIIGINLEQYTEFRHGCKPIHRVIMRGGLNAAITEHTILQTAFSSRAGLQIVEIGHNNTVSFHLAGGILENGAVVNRRNLLADTLGSSIQACQFPLTADTAHIVAAVIVSRSAPEVGTRDLLHHFLAGIAVGSQAAVQIREQHVKVFTTDTNVVGALHDSKRNRLFAGHRTDCCDHALSKSNFMTFFRPEGIVFQPGTAGTMNGSGK